MVGNKRKAWVVSVDMGYGHQRAAYPLQDIAYERIITANSDKIVMPREAKRWRKLMRSYYLVSRFRAIPIIGKFVWNIFDRFQSISPFYPFRDLSRPTIGALFYYRNIKKGLVEGVIDYVKREKLPFISTFFVPALAAVHHHIKDVYCVVTDTDIHRGWVPRHPKKEKLYYLTPTEHSTKRIIEYGVPARNIFFTGFPLPKENTGKDIEILKKDLGNRLPNLDPNKIYLSKYRAVIKDHLGRNYKKKSNHPLTITFAVGGAGAQKKIGGVILKSLKRQIKEHHIRLNLIAGTRPEVERYFIEIVEKLNLSNDLGSYVNIFCALTKKKHFQGFNELLHETDILWTKPSEMSFYTALGLPIIIAPPFGSHEELNRKWLIKMGTGIDQEFPTYVNEWLYEWLNRGILAEAAMEGYLEAPKYGTYNIENIIFAKDKSKVKFKY